MPKHIYLLGIFLEVCSTLTGTAGKQLIRLSELQYRKGWLSTSRCTFGIGMFTNIIVGPVLDMAAYSFAAASLIAPFGGLDVVWNALLAPVILHEKLTRSRIIACVLIFLGTVLSGVFGEHVDQEYNVEMLERLLGDVRVIIYLVALFVFIFVNIVIQCKRPKGNVIRGISLGVTAGVIAGNMFCTKALVELIETTIYKDALYMWEHYIPYVVLFGGIFFALTNLIFMTQGLLEFEALFMVTAYEGSMIIANCLSASVILRENEDLEPWRLACWILSVLTVVCGMFEICRGEYAASRYLNANTLNSSNASEADEPSEGSGGDKLTGEDEDCDYDPKDDFGGGVGDDLDGPTFDVDEPLQIQPAEVSPAGDGAKEEKGG